jgi:hypothetical protein
MDSKNKSINVYHKLLKSQLGKHKSLISYYKAYNSGNMELANIDTNIAFHRRMGNIRTVHKLGWKRVATTKTMKQRLRAANK